MRIQVFLLLCLAAAGAAAQDVPFFPQPAYFKRSFATTSNKYELQPPVRLEEFVIDGKLELSLKSYLDLVMSNNPDITIQKVSIERQQNAILRAFAPFDPFLQGSFNATRQNTPFTSAFANAASNNTSANVGTLTIKQLTQPFALNYNQTLMNGTSYSVGYANTRFSTNNESQYNPSNTSTLTMGFSQPLLRGRGAFVTKLPITIARGNFRASTFNLEDRVLQLVVTAELAYWAVIEARENVRVNEKALELADIALKRSKRELELGAISSLEIFQPEANYANAEIFLTQARYRLAQAEDFLRRQMGADQDPRIRELGIVLTETAAPPVAPPTFDREKTVDKALARRQDLRGVNENLAVDDLGIRLADNSLRPDLALTGQYASFGQGGIFYPQPTDAGTILPPVPGGYGDAMSQLFGFGFPTYAMGVRLRLPIKNRAAEADLADAVLNKKLDTLRRKQLAQDIRLQVLQAISQIENSKASVELAKVARDLAQNRVDAEQKRYELGTTTIFFVLAAQNDLTTAESVLVRESINYRRNLLQLSQRTGELLDERGISIQ